MQTEVKVLAQSLHARRGFVRQFTLAEARVDDDEISDPPDAVGYMKCKDIKIWQGNMYYIYHDKSSYNSHCIF